MHYYTRSHRTTDEDCPRARFWWSCYGDHGIEAVGEAIELSYGTLVHAALAGIMDPDGQQSLDDLVDNGIEALEILLHGQPELTLRELSSLFEGHVRGFARVVAPRLKDAYEVVSIEREFRKVVAPGIMLGVKPDLILRRKFDDTLWYVEYKTTKNVGKEWMESWATNVQLQAGCVLVGEELGEPVEGCIIQGLYKGYNFRGEYRSPLVYRWRKPGLPGQPDEVVPERPAKWAGWHREGNWEREGVKTWLEAMPQAVLEEQFPQTPPMFINKELIDAWLRQSAIREEDIRNAVVGLEDLSADDRLRVMDTVFPQTFSRCRPAWGRGCKFFDACWLAHIQDDPIGSGLFRERVFHHEGEEEEHGD